MSAVAVGAASFCACGALACWWVRQDDSSATGTAQPSDMAEDTAVDFTALTAALGPRPPDEEVLFQAWQPGDGTKLAASWAWVRQESGWCVDKHGQLLLRCAKGGSSGAGASGIRNLLLREFPSTKCGWGRAAVTAVVHTGGKELGEQAGLVWYRDDSNYLKLVLQVGRDGVVSVVFAAVVDGDVTFVAEKECPANGAAPANLRIELAPAGGSAAAILDLAYCEQLVGVCEDVSALGLVGDEVRVGVMANGASGTDDQPSTQFAAFSNFNLLGLAPDRVSFTSDPTTSLSALQALDGLTGASSGEAGSEMTAAHNLHGWTLSEDLSSTERDEIAGLLASVGPPPVGGQKMPAFSVVHNPQ